MLVEIGPKMGDRSVEDTPESLQELVLIILNNNYEIRVSSTVILCVQESQKVASNFLIMCYLKIDFYLV